MPHGVTPKTQVTVERFREFLVKSLEEETLKPDAKLTRGMSWSRQAASLTEALDGTALERATLYGELHLQMKAVDKTWYTGYDVGTQGEHLFTSNPVKGRFFSILDEGCYVGPQSVFTKDAAGRIAVNYHAPEVKGFVAERTPKVRAPSAAVKAPAVKAPAVKAPAAEATAVEAAATPARPVRPGVNVGLGTRLLIGLGIQFLIGLLIDWALDELESRRVSELFRTTVDPDVQKALKDASPEAEALGEEDPFQTVYANIGIDLTYTGSRGGMSGGQISESLSSATVREVVMSREEKEDQSPVSDEQSHTILANSITKRVVRMTYSVAVPWDRPAADRIAWTAEVNVRKGLPARWAIAGRPWDAKQTLRFVEAYVGVTAGDPSRKALHDDAEELRADLAREQRFGAASLKSAAAAARAGKSARVAAADTHWSSNAQRENFVAAYVEVTRDVAAWRSLHDDASAYLAQLRSTSTSSGAPRTSILEGALSR